MQNSEASEDGNQAQGNLTYKAVRLYILFAHTRRNLILLLKPLFVVCITFCQASLFNTALKEKPHTPVCAVYSYIF